MIAGHGKIGSEWRSLGRGKVEEDGFVNISFTLHCAVYALRKRRVVVYVGKSKKPLTRLYSHVNARGKFPQVGVKKISFDEIWIRPCMLSELDALEVEMIRKYQPRYNVKHRAPTPIPDDIRALLATIHIEPTPGPLEPRLYIRRRL